MTGRNRGLARFRYMELTRGRHLGLFDSRQIILVAIACLIAIVAGLVSTLGSTRIFIVMLGIILMPFVLVIPLRNLVSSQLALVFVVVGLVQYFGKVSQAHWLPTLLFMAMLLRVPIEAYSNGAGSRSNARISSLLTLLAMYVGVVVLSAIINSTPAVNFLVGLRHYVFPLALVWVIVYARLDSGFWLRVLHWLPWLLIIQFPISLYQNLVVARHREVEFGSVGISWDAVVGTFGGNADGGGASGALALFLCFGLAAIDLLRRRGLISKRLFVLSGLCAILSIFLAEVKVAVVFLPLAFLVTHRERVLKSLFAAVAWVVLSGVFVVVLLGSYSLLFWKGHVAGVDSFTGVVAYVLKADGNPRFVNKLTGEVSRSGAILLWYDENVSRKTTIQTVVGNGPAASKISSLFGYGAAARRHSFTLTTSSVSMALWDIGIAGVVALVMVLALAVRDLCVAASVAKGHDASASVTFDVAAVGLALISAGVLYNPDLLNHSAIQALFAVAVGLAAKFQRTGLQEPGSLRRSA